MKEGEGSSNDCNPRPGTKTFSELKDGGSKKFGKIGSKFIFKITNKD